MTVKGSGINTLKMTLILGAYMEHLLLFKSL